MSFLSLSQNASSKKDQPYAINESEVITPKPASDVDTAPAVDEAAAPTITPSNDELPQTSDVEIVHQ